MHLLSDFLRHLLPPVRETAANSHTELFLAAFIENDESDKALEYIHGLVKTTEKTVTDRYCANEIINIILLISVENPYATSPKLENGMPIAKEKGHGLGTRSIKLTANRLGGNCQFSVTDKLFIVRVII